MKKYSIPLLRDRQQLFLGVFDKTENAVTECYNLLQVHSFALISKPILKWKQPDFSDNGEVHDVYRTKRREYRKHLREFMNQIEIDKAAKLCNAAHSNENSFWKLLKNRKFSSQMSEFLTDGKMITDKTIFAKCGPSTFKN